MTREQVRDALGRLPRARARRAGPAQDAYAATLDVERYLYRCGLKTASLFAAACRLGSLAAGASEHDGRGARPLRPQDRARVPAARRRARRCRPAERTGKQRGTDLLDGTVTLPLILAAEPTPSCASSTCARSPRGARRSGSATGSPRPTALERARETPAAWSARRSPSSRRARRRGRPSCCSWSPTASSTVIRLAIPVFAYGAKTGRAAERLDSRLKVFGEDVVVRERFAEAVDLLFHVRVDRRFRSSTSWSVPRSSSSSKRSTVSWSNTSGLGPLAVGTAKRDLPAESGPPRSSAPGRRGSSRSRGRRAARARQLLRSLRPLLSWK